MWRLKNLDDLLEKIKVTSTKRLTKDLINNHSILNNGNFFFFDGSENYSVLQLFSITLHQKMVKFVRGNQNECQKKALHVHLQQIIVLIQK